MNEQSFKNHFLIAMPSLTDDSFFKECVIFLCEHDHEGALGIMINKTLNVKLNSVLEQMDMKSSAPYAKQWVFMGGPVGQEHGFVIHTPYREDEAQDDLVISASRETLSDIANNTGPTDYLIALGYTGWSPGQLESEISQNDWLLAPYSKNILFDTPPKMRWQHAIKLLGFSHTQLSTQEGHA